MQDQVRIVLCTVPNEGVAETLARALLEERLAACVNILPGVRSMYRWQGEIEDDRELLLVIKTQADRYQQLEQRIRALHPYQVCEVLSFDVVEGSKPYVDWLISETQLRP